MPELPEVEAARMAVEAHCLGKKIVRAIIADDPVVIDGGISPSDFEASLLNKTIVAAHRKGKNMWLQLDSPPFPTFQFGMTGAIYVKGVAVTKYKRSAVKDTDEWPSKYSKFFIELDNGLELSFTDKRRFARVRLLEDPTLVSPISELGPDALLEPMTLDDFFTSLQKKTTGLKALLLDQSFISGIGNWIADEVLYQARIHPVQSASSLSKEQCATLHKCIKEVIQKAVQVGADDSQFPSNWIYHSRDKKPGKAFVDGKKIEFITAGGRTTAYVPELQKRSGDQAVKAAKTGKQASKRKKQESEAGADDNDSSGGAENAKAKPQDKGVVKKSSTRKRSMKSDGDDHSSDDEGGGIDVQRKTMTKDNKAPGKRKLRSSSGDDDDGVEAKKSGADTAPSKTMSGGRNEKEARKTKSKTKAGNISKKKEQLKK